MTSYSYLMRRDGHELASGRKKQIKRSGRAGSGRVYAADDPEGGLAALAMTHDKGGGTAAADLVMTDDCRSGRGTTIGSPRHRLRSSSDLEPDFEDIVTDQKFH